MTGDRRTRMLIGRLFVAALIACLAAGAFLSLGGTEAAGQGGESNVPTVYVSLVDDGPDRARIVVSVDPVEAFGAITADISIDPATIVPDRTADNAPVCRIFSPWAGACGPGAPVDELQLGVFALPPSDGPVLIEFPVAIIGEPDLPELSIRVVGDQDALPITAAVASTRGLPDFLSGESPPPVVVDIDCGAREIRIGSADPVIEAQTVAFDGTPGTTTLSGVDATFTIVPDEWIFESLLLTLDGAGGERQLELLGYAWCDDDGDGIIDWDDNCPSRTNANQLDRNGDGVGDACRRSCDFTLDEELTDPDFFALEALRAGGSSFVCSIGDYGGIKRVNSVHITSAGDLTPLGDLDLLTFLDLSGLGLDAVPPAVFGADSLLDLDLSGNEIGALPASIGSLDSLRTLDVSDNRLVTLPPEIGGLAMITRLELADNRLRELPAELGQLATLVTLDLERNELAEIPSLTGTRLSTVALAGNQLESIPALPDYVELELDLRDNRLRGDLTSFFDTYYGELREFGSDSQVLVDDGPGGNDCVYSANPGASEVWGLPPISFECEAGGVISGVVLSETGTPLFGANVCAERPLQIAVCTFTGPDGGFALDVGPGNVRLVAAHWDPRIALLETDWYGVGAYEGVDGLELSFGSTGVVSPDPGPEPPDPDPFPTPPGSAIVGVVVDGAGEPVAGANVCAERGLVGDGGCATSRVDGTFLIDDLAPGNYGVTATSGAASGTFRWAGVALTQAALDIEVRIG